MQTINCFRRLFILLTFTVPGVALAAELPAPHQLVQRSADKVLTISRSIDDVNAIDEEHVQRLLGRLEPVVAFDRIARAVIGENNSGISNQEIARFTDTFKSTMTRFYLETLVTFDVTQASVEAPNESLAAEATRATVGVEAQDADGNRYQLDYSLSTNDSGDWQVHNMILDGVNLGLSYRSQFNSAMNTFNGDVDRVIDNWRDFVEQ